MGTVDEEILSRLDPKEPGRIGPEDQKESDPTSNIGEEAIVGFEKARIKKAFERAGIA